jgi:hypothetical protein
MLHINKLTFLTLAVLLLTPLAALQAAGLANLRCEFRVNPLGIDASRPRLSWVIESKDKGVLQTAYQVVVEGVWDSGKVPSDKSQNIEYSGKPLVSGIRYNWIVRVWDNSGKVSGWSKPAWWIMGLLKPEDWTARWISTEMDDQIVPTPPASQPKPIDEPYVRREFDLAAIPTSALATVNVMGFYELYVNGKKVGPNVMGPALSNYGKRSLYETYDLTPYLQKGRNCIGMWLSRGWYWKVLDSRPNPNVQHETAIARMQMSGYKKLEYPAYTLYRSLHQQGKLAQPFDRFMSSQKPEIELYNLMNDPEEIKDLADDQRYRGVRDQLYNTLIDSLKKFEKNIIPEKMEPIQKAKDSSASYFQSGMKKIGLSDQSTNEEILKYWEKILIR